MTMFWVSYLDSCIKPGFLGRKSLFISLSFQRLTYVLCSLQISLASRSIAGLAWTPVGYLAGISLMENCLNHENFNALLLHGKMIAPLGLLSDRFRKFWARLAVKRDQRRPSKFTKTDRLPYFWERHMHPFDTQQTQLVFRSSGTTADSVASG
jgi:hypothetical protein